MITELLIPNIADARICVHDLDTVSASSVWDWHMHEEYEIYMTLEGERTYYVGEKEYIVKKGEIIFINEQVPHKTITDKGNVGFVLQFNPLTATSDAQKSVMHFINYATNDVYIFKTETPINNELSLSLKSIIAENSEKGKFFENFIVSDVYKIFAILYRYDIIKNTESFRFTKEIAKIQPVISYINEHYHEKLTLEQMSELVNFDKSHFCRVFKKCVNTSLVDYINYIRVCKAEKLIVSTNKSIAEIAEETGFSSVAYFTKTFKAIKSCTPTQYKKFKS